VHSEIVFSLSPNNNVTSHYSSLDSNLLIPQKIAESFRRFGISPTTSSLLVIKVSTPSSSYTATSIQEHLTANIEGEQIAFTDEELRQITDLARVKKIYKLNAGGGGGKKGHVNGNIASGVKVDEEKELEVWVLGSMALRGATN
jgi:EKC/KEOPS complex subunit CGI121/TPRKB